MKNATRSVGWRLQRWDIATALQGLFFAAILAFGMFALTTITGEGGITLTQKLARSSMTTPLIAILVTGLTIRTPRAQEAMRSLSLLGIPPWRASLSTVLISGFATLAISLFVWLQPGAAREFFPSIGGASVRWTGEGFLDPASGMLIRASGELQRVADPIVAVAREQRGLAAFAVFAFGLSGAMEAAHARRSELRLTAVAAAVAFVLTSVAFHRAAISPTPPILLGIPALIFLLRSIRRYALSR